MIARVRPETRHEAGRLLGGLEYGVPAEVNTADAFHIELAILLLATLYKGIFRVVSRLEVLLLITLVIIFCLVLIVLLIISPQENALRRQPSFPV